MIIFRVAQGIAWTSQTSASDLTIHGIPGRLEHRSIIRFRAISGEHDTSQPRNPLHLDELRDVLDAESNSHGISYKSHTTNSAGITDKVGPNTN